jgi:hypothetical protein
MSFDDAGRSLSADQLFARIRALLGPSVDDGTMALTAPPTPGGSPLRSGLIGSGWARFTADHDLGPQADASNLDPVSWRPPATMSGLATAKRYPTDLDSTIDAKVAAFNKMNQADPGDDVYLDPDWVRAMVRVESAFDPKAYRSDPMQVNKPGDWYEDKADLGLKEGVAPGQDLGVKAGVDWLESKAYRYDGRAGAKFLGWDRATQRYNGGGNPHYLEDVKQAYRDIKAGR